MTVITIKANRIVAVTERLNKIAKRAAKYDCVPVEFSFGEPYAVTITNIEGRKVQVYLVECTVTGAAPKIEGWTMLARVEMFSQEATLVHSVPGLDIEVDARFRTHKGECEHCNKIRNRKDVYVFDDGEKQIAVGRTCLRDYMGIDDPAKVTASMGLFEAMNEMMDEERGLVFGVHNQYLSKVLAHTAYFIRVMGWTSAAKSRDTGDIRTADAVNNSFGVNPHYVAEPTSEDVTKAAETIAYMRNEDNLFEGQYMENLQVLFKEDYVEQKHFGLVCSAVATVTMQKERAKKEDRTCNSVHMGEVKKRMKGLDVEVTGVRCLGESQFGLKYLVKMLCGENELTWFTGNPKDLEEGNMITIDATVKEHNVFNHTLQTIVTRVTVK